jgi:hypothetical protein
MGLQVVVVLWPPSNAISIVLAVLAIGTSVSFHGKNDTAMQWHNLTLKMETQLIQRQIVQDKIWNL